MKRIPEPARASMFDGEVLDPEIVGEDEDDVRLGRGKEREAADEKKFPVNH